MNPYLDLAVRATPEGRLLGDIGGGYYSLDGQRRPIRLCGGVEEGGPVGQTASRLGGRHRQGYGLGGRQERLGQPGAENGHHLSWLRLLRSQYERLKVRAGDNHRRLLLISLLISLLLVSLLLVSIELDEVVAVEVAELALDLVVVGLPVSLRGGDRDEEVVDGAGRGRGYCEGRLLLGRLLFWIGPVVLLVPVDHHGVGDPGVAAMGAPDYGRGDSDYLF